MSNIYKSITELVGQTPLLELTRLQEKYQLKARILAKLEYFNATGSVKDRPVIEMIEEAEKRGDLKAGDKIVDTTSGNTGIALAAFGRAKGYQVELILDPNVSVERTQILKALGVNLKYYTDLPDFAKLIESGDLNYRAIKEIMTDYAKEIGAYYICQIDNADNPQAHVKTTGPELWRDTDGEIDYFVTMTGTGGTLLGVGTYLREKKEKIQLIGVQPDPLSIRSPDQPDVNIIDGVEPFTEFVEPQQVPLFVKENSYDRYFNVVAEEAYETARDLALTEGLFLGVSAAATLNTAIQIAKEEEAAGKTIVAMVPDNGFKYLSLPIYQI